MPRSPSALRCVTPPTTALDEQLSDSLSMTWNRGEIEAEFAKYRARAAAAATSGDWREWADQFTDDARYVEHHFGELEGREAIFEWIQSTMDAWPNSLMVEFPVDWYVVDETRGWVVFQVQNRLADPGDGSVWQEHNLTILHYAGDGQWSYEEDVYNPARMGAMVMSYLEHAKAL